jgi:hypothetical protein
MFGLFLSKNQKLVKRWQKEHRQIVSLVHDFSSAYMEDRHQTAKKRLKALKSLVIEHIMNEDIEIYRLMKDEKRIDIQTEALVDEFLQSFKKTKLSLIAFLENAAKPETKLDDTFFVTFKDIMKVVVKRIDFEEKNLYSKLEKI